MKKVCYLLFTFSLAINGCQTIRQQTVKKQISHELQHNPLFTSEFTGFTLYDPESGKTLAEHNSHLRFTPASNNKILTTLACLYSLGDSIPSISYSIHNDSLFIKPLADPTFLHPAFQDQRAFDLMKGKKVFIAYPNEKLDRYGPGWAWEDYEYYYQPEVSWMPIYGNVTRIFNSEDSLKIVPSFFKDFTNISIGQRPGNLIYRTEFANIFNAWIETETSSYEREIPFIYTKELLGSLLADTLNAEIAFIDSIPEGLNDTLFSQPRDSVIQKMMYPSDNFLAEHLLLQSALNQGFNNTDEFRKLMLEKWQYFLPDQMRWVDGSGLSRYNLISPANLAGILNEIYIIGGWEFIENTFPIGGVSGTLKNSYQAEEPYLYAKTGTVSNNHNISGFIKTRSGKILIFSFMNNHYIASTSSIKAEMEKIFIKIRDTY